MLKVLLKPLTDTVFIPFYKNKQKKTLLLSRKQRFSPLLTASGKNAESKFGSARWPERTKQLLSGALVTDLAEATVQCKCPLWHHKLAFLFKDMLSMKWSKRQKRGLDLDWIHPTGERHRFTAARKQRWKVVFFLHNQGRYTNLASTKTCLGHSSNTFHCVFTSYELEHVFE